MVSEKRRKNNREAQRRYRKRQAEKLTQPGVSSPPASGPVTIESAEDLKRILAEQINLTRQSTAGDELVRARVVGYLCGQALRNIEVGEMEARIRAIEEQIGRPK